MTTDRRKFMMKAAAAWRLSTAWTPALDMLQGAAVRLAKVVEKISAGLTRWDQVASGAYHQFVAV